MAADSQVACPTIASPTGRVGACLPSVSLGRDWHPLDIYLLPCLLIALVAGGIARVDGLGNWPFSHKDEYYTVQSIQSIVQHGLPQFNLAGYYTRGILYQYVCAGLLKLGLQAEFALRMVSAVFNLLTLIPLYLIGRKVAGRAATTIAVILFSLSIWEIEFARFARSYAMFQFVFLWYIYFLYRAIIDNRTRFMPWLVLTSLVGTLVHETGVFLVVLNFSPFVLSRETWSRSIICRWLLVCAGVLVVAVQFVTFDFRRLGKADTLPGGVSTEAHAGGFIDTPVPILRALSAEPFWWIPFAALLVGVGMACYITLSDPQARRSAQTALIGCLLLALAGTCGLAIYWLIGCVLVGWLRWSDVKAGSSRACVVVGLLTLVFWAAFGAVQTPLEQSFPALVSRSPFKQLLVLLIDYPRIYDQIISEYLEAIPLFTWAAMALVGLGVIDAVRRRSRHAEGYCLVAALLLFLALTVGVSNTPYGSTRYTFFLFPLALLLIAMSLVRLGELASVRPQVGALVVLVALGAFLVVSEDCDLSHMRNVDTAQVHFRTKYGINSPRAAHYYRRVDMRSPAEVVNRNLAKNDIVIATLHGPDYYLERQDYFYKNANSKITLSVSAQGGTKHLWSESNLLVEEAALFHLLDSAADVIWIVAHTEGFKNCTREEKELARRYAACRVYVSPDGMVAVYRVAPAGRT